MVKFGLIGRTLKHSYSAKIHALLGDYIYELKELEPEDVKNFALSREFKGYNVTIPYKKEIMNYLDEIDESALNIGAVNTVVDNDGILKGYNTDFDGMKYMFRRAGISIGGKKVMILGTGGTSNTAIAVAKSLGAREIVIVSRSGQVNYQNYTEHCDTEVIINTTPVGMYPNNYESPIELEAFSCLTGVADVIYNPNMTALTAKAKEKGVSYTNGLPMLVAQAKYAMEKFFDKEVSDSVIEDVLNTLEKQTLSIVLVGMPGSGKSTVGKSLADALGREFIDTDEEIVKKEGKIIPDIFKEHGEEYFRRIESEVLKSVGILTGKVISTGGGVVKNRQNYFALKQNSVIIWIDRNLESLATGGRPLSKDIETVKKLYDERKDSYAYFADFKVDNNGEVSETVKGVLSNL